MADRMIDQEMPLAAVMRPAGDQATRTPALSKDRPAALIITFDGFFDAYDLTRSLGKDGIRSYVATTGGANPAKFSKYCKGIYKLPDHSPENEKAIAQRLIEISDELGGERPVLFYASDPELLFIQRHYAELLEHFRFLLPPDELLDNVFSKVNFSRFASANSLPVPSAFTIETPADFEKVQSSIRFPCIVKPAFQHDWYWKSEEELKFFGWYKNALRRFESMEKLSEFIGHLPERSAGYLIQSYVDGGDDSISSFHGYFDEDSRCLGWFLGRKIRTSPPMTGSSSYIRTIVDDNLARKSIAHLKRIRFRGIVKIDYKWDSVNREHQMLEINPRFNLWEILGTYAGVNLCSIAYRHLTGEVAPQQVRQRAGSAVMYEDDRRFLFLKGDLRGYFAGYRKTKEWTFGSYVGSLFRPMVYRLFDPADPLPFVWSSLRFTGSLFVRMFRRIGGVLKGRSG